MTLVVARHLDNFLRIVSDTKITDTRNTRPSNLDGALKAVIIDHALCVCYADDAEIGKDAIEQVYKKRQDAGSLDEILEYLSSQTRIRRGNNSSVEFLVITGLPTPGIRKISNGNVDPPSSVNYIGDYAAFCAFQRALRDQISHGDMPPGLRELSKMNGALESVIQNSELPCVGGFAVEIGLYRNGFEYHIKAYSHSGALESDAKQNIPGSEWTTLQLVHSATSGGYTYSLCPPVEPGIGALGVYFNQTRLGALYFPAKNRDVKLYKGVGSAEFVKRVRYDFGFELFESGFEQL